MHVCVHTHVSDREVTYTRVCVAFSLAQMPDSRSVFWHFSRIPACRESPAAPELLRLNPASDSWGPPAFPAPRAEPASGFRARVSPSWGAHGRAVCLLTFTDVSCAPPFPPTHTPEFSKILMSVTPPGGLPRLVVSTQRAPEPGRRARCSPALGAPRARTAPGEWWVWLSEKAACS